MDAWLSGRDRASLAREARADPRKATIARTEDEAGSDSSPSPRPHSCPLILHTAACGQVSEACFPYHHLHHPHFPSTNAS